MFFGYPLAAGEHGEGEEGKLKPIANAMTYSKLDYFTSGITRSIHRRKNC